VKGVYGGEGGMRDTESTFLQIFFFNSLNSCLGGPVVEHLIITRCSIGWILTYLFVVTRSALYHLITAANFSTT